MLSNRSLPRSFLPSPASEVVAVLFWLVTGCAALCSVASAQTASLTASRSTYAAAGGTVTLTATVVYPTGSNALSGVTVVSGGAGYTAAPTVTFSGGAGTGASATATISGGAVTAVTLTNPGSGYGSPPSVVFSGGSATTVATANATAALPTAISFLVKLPAGWTFVSQTLPPGAAASVAPESGYAILEWAFSSFPVGPLSWSFDVAYPANLSGSQVISVDPLQSMYRPGAVALTGVPDLTLTAAASAPAITSATTASATVGTAFSYQITASNSPASYSATGLPAGLSINTTTGLISGAPTTVGTSTVSLAATNAGGTSATVNLTLTVSPKVLTVSGVTVANKVYDGTTTATAFFTGATLNGVMTGETVVLVTSGATATFADKNAGTSKTVTIAGLSLSGSNVANYTLTQPMATADITTKALTAKADNKSMIQGAAIPALTITYTGFVSGETKTIITEPSISTTATAASPAGDFPITLSGGSAVNYTLSLQSGTLTVTATTPSFAFSQQPVAITRNRGETASFTVNAAGGAGTVTYKWYKDNVAIQDVFGRIAGSGAANLVISNVGAADAGSYSATATTAQNGTINSTGGALTVLAGPTITRAALDVSVVAAGSATFSVAASGTGTLAYQWYFTPASGGSTVPLVDIASKIAGASSSSLTVSSVQKPNDEGFYSCSVTDSAGNARSSASLSIVSRVLKISAPNAVPGADVVISVLLQANGDENSANFAIVFDPSKLSYKSFAAGSQSDSASSSVPAGTSGRLNVLVGKTPPDVWVAGSNEIARITFTSGTSSGSSLVGFDDLSLSSPRSVSSALGQPLVAGYQAAYFTSISGLEGDIDGDGKLTAADWTAMGRIILGLDPAPSGEKFMRADCAPRLGTGGALQLGDKRFDAADWTQVGRYVLGLDTVTTIGGPSGP